MEIPFSPEKEAQLSHLAQERGSDVGRFVLGVVERYLDQELRFIEGVQAGFDELDRGEFITMEEMDERLKKLIRP